MEHLYFSSAHASHIDLFGGPTFSDDPAFLAKIEGKTEDACFVIISDVWLDQPRVFEKLRTMFEGQMISYM